MLTDAPALESKSTPLQLDNTLVSYLPNALKILPDCAERSLQALLYFIEHGHGATDEHGRGPYRFRERILAPTEDDPHNQKWVIVYKTLEADALNTLLEQALETLRAQLTNEGLTTAQQKLDALIQDNADITTHGQALDELFRTHLQPLDISSMMETSHLRRHASELTEKQECIVLVGDTGAGKSTLIYLLRNCTLRYQHGVMRWTHRDRETARFVIGDGTESQTKMVESIAATSLKGKEYILSDTPGFGDTDGAETALLTPFLIREALTPASSIRLLSAVKVSSFTASRGQPFFDSLESIAKLVPNIEEHLRSLLLVITGINDAINPETIADILQRYVSNRPKSLSDKAYAILCHLHTSLSQRTPSVIFFHGIAEKDSVQQRHMEQQRKAVWSALESLTPMPSAFSAFAENKHIEKARRQVELHLAAIRRVFDYLDDASHYSTPNARKKLSHQLGRLNQKLEEIVFLSEILPGVTQTAQAECQRRYARLYATLETEFRRLSQHNMKSPLDQRTVSQSHNILAIKTVLIHVIGELLRPQEDDEKAHEREAAAAAPAAITDDAAVETIDTAHVSALFTQAKTALDEYSTYIEHDVAFEVQHTVPGILANKNREAEQLGTPCVNLPENDPILSGLAETIAAKAGIDIDRCTNFLTNQRETLGDRKQITSKLITLLTNLQLLSSQYQTSLEEDADTIILAFSDRLLQRLEALSAAASDYAGFWAHLQLLGKLSTVFDEVLPGVGQAHKVGDEKEAIEADKAALIQRFNDQRHQFITALWHFVHPMTQMLASEATLTEGQVKEAIFRSSVLGKLFVEPNIFSWFQGCQVALENGDTCSLESIVESVWGTKKRMELVKTHDDSSDNSDSDDDDEKADDAPDVAENEAGAVKTFAKSMLEALQRQCDLITTGDSHQIDANLTAIAALTPRVTQVFYALSLPHPDLFDFNSSKARVAETIKAALLRVISPWQSRLAQAAPIDEVTYQQMQRYFESTGGIEWLVKLDLHTDCVTALQTHIKLRIDAHVTRLARLDFNLLATESIEQAVVFLNELQLLKTTLQESLTEDTRTLLDTTLDTYNQRLSVTLLGVSDLTNDPSQHLVDSTTPRGERTSVIIRTLQPSQSPDEDESKAAFSGPLDITKLTTVARTVLAVTHCQTPVREQASNANGWLHNFVRDYTARKDSLCQRTLNLLKEFDPSRVNDPLRRSDSNTPNSEQVILVIELLGLSYAELKEYQADLPDTYNNAASVTEDWRLLVGKLYEDIEKALDALFSSAVTGDEIAKARLPLQIDFIEMLLPLDDLLPEGAAFRNRNFAGLHHRYQSVKSNDAIVGEAKTLIVLINEGEFDRLTSAIAELPPTSPLRPLITAQIQQKIRLALRDCHKTAERLAAASTAKCVDFNPLQKQIATLRSLQPLVEQYANSDVKAGYEHERQHAQQSLNQWLANIIGTAETERRAYRYSWNIETLASLQEVLDEEKDGPVVMRPESHQHKRGEMALALRTSFTELTELRVENQRTLRAIYDGLHTHNAFESWEEYSSSSLWDAVAQRLVRECGERLTTAHTEFTESRLNLEQLLEVIRTQAQLVVRLPDDNDCRQQVEGQCYTLLDKLDADTALSLATRLALLAAHTQMKQVLQRLSLPHTSTFVSEHLSSLAQDTNDKLARSEYPEEELNKLQQLSQLLPNLQRVTTLYESTIETVTERIKASARTIHNMFDAAKTGANPELSIAQLAAEINFLVQACQSSHTSGLIDEPLRAAINAELRAIHTYLCQARNQVDSSLNAREMNSLVLTLGTLKRWEAVRKALENAVQVGFSLSSNDEKATPLATLTLHDSATSVFTVLEQHIRQAGLLQDNLATQGRELRVQYYQAQQGVATFIASAEEKLTPLIGDYRDGRTTLDTDFGLGVFQKSTAERLRVLSLQAKATLDNEHSLSPDTNWRNFEAQLREMQVFAECCVASHELNTLMLELTTSAHGSGAAKINRVFDNRGAESAQTTVPAIQAANALITYLEQRITHQSQGLIRGYNDVKSEDNRQAIVGFLVNLQKIINDVPSLSNRVRKLVANFLSGLQQAVGPQHLQLLATALQQDDTGLGGQLIQEQECFKGIAVALRNTRTQAYGIEHILANLQLSAGTEPEPASEEQKDILRGKYFRFQAKYDALLEEYLKPELDFEKDPETHLTELRDSLQTLLPLSSEAHASDISESLPEILAHLFAIWTLRDSKAYFSAGDNPDRNFLKKPHAAQIVAILLQLGCEHGQLVSHLSQILTGEGKSVVMALTAAVLALHGYEVDAACYSEFLSRRDANDFEGIFNFLGLKHLIRYGTFNQLLERSLNQDYDLRTLTAVALGEEEKLERPDHRQPTRDRVLLVDEVDVFFKRDFYGSLYRPTVIIQSDEFTTLVEFIWSQHTRDVTLTLSGVKKSEQYRAWLAKYPRYEALLSNTLANMLGDLQKYTAGQDHHYHVKEDRLVYDYQDGTSAERIEGYRTMWAALHERDRGTQLTRDSAQRYIGMQVGCGAFSYTRLLQESGFKAILGVTGTLKEMSATEQAIVRRDFNIVGRSFLPSAYGENQLVFREQAAVKICESKQSHHRQLVVDISQARVGSRDEGVNRPVIVFFKDEDSLQAFYQSGEFEDFKDSCSLMTDSSISTPEEQQAAITRATQAGVITLALAKYGRGRDFVCYDAKVNANGGLHVTQAFLSEQEAEERQIKGRTARQGQAGSYSLIVNQQEVERDFSLEGHDGLELDPITADQAPYPQLQARRNAIFAARYQALNDGIAKATETYHEPSRQLQRALVTDSEDTGVGTTEATSVSELLAAVNPSYSDGPVQSTNTLILFDATGSMQCLINNLKNTLSEVMKGLATVFMRYNIDPKQHFVRIAAYRNFSSGPNEIVESSSWESISSPDALTEFVSGIYASGGQHCEAIEVGLRVATNGLSDDPHAPTAVIQIGDMPPHGSLDCSRGYTSESCTLEKHYNECSKRYRLISEATKLAIFGPTKQASNAQNYQTELAKLKVAGVPLHARYIEKDSYFEPSIQLVYQDMAERAGDGGSYERLGAKGDAGIQQLFTLFGTSIISQVAADPTKRKAMISELEQYAASFTAGR